MARLLLASVDCLPRIGGISTMTHHFANGLARQGYEVSVLGPAGSYVPDGWEADYEVLVDEEARPTAREGVEWTRTERPRLDAFLSSLWQEKDFVRAIAVHPFYFAPPLQDVGKRMGRPVSIVFHGYELRSQLMLRSRRHAAMVRFRGHGPTVRDETLATARRADEILVNSQYTQKLVRRTGTRAPIRVIGCGVDRQRVDIELAVTSTDAARWRRAVRDRLAVPQDALLVGTIGRLVGSKNPIDLVRLLQHNERVYAVIAGAGPERAAIERLAREARVDARLRLEDQLDETEKWKLLRALDVFCLLSTPTSLGEVEGFGIVLLEASLAGIPVIAARTGGMVDVVSHRQSGLIVPGRNVRALDEAVRWIADNPEQAAGMVDQARQNIVQRFNFDQIARDTLSNWGLSRREAIGP